MGCGVSVCVCVGGGVLDLLWAGRKTEIDSCRRPPDGVVESMCSAQQQQPA